MAEKNCRQATKSTNEICMYSSKKSYRLRIKELFYWFFWKKQKQKMMAGFISLHCRRLVLRLFSAYFLERDRKLATFFFVFKKQRLYSRSHFTFSQVHLSNGYEGYQMFTCWKVLCLYKLLLCILPKSDKIFVKNFKRDKFV